MTFDFFAFHWLEGAGAYVEGQFLTVDAMFVERLQYTFGEMQAGGRSSYRTLYLLIHRLISLLVAFLRLAIQVWRDGEFAHGF